MHLKSKHLLLLARTTIIDRFIFLSVFALLVVGCSQSPTNQPTSEPAVPIQDLDITVGQTIYVPAYTKIYASPRGQTLDLTVTLSIHNTDTNNSIIMTSVRYYDAQGELVKEYLTSPVQLRPLSTADFYVDIEALEAGDPGLGANFIVEWGAEQPVYEPIVEAIMIHADSTQGISFTSPGRVISQLQSEQPEEE